MNEPYRGFEVSEYATAGDAEITSQKTAEMRQKYEARNEHRDFSVYYQEMGAATRAKAEALLPYFGGEIGEGSVIVDAGSGTGQVAALVAQELRGAKVYAQDISHEALETSTLERALIHPIYGNVVEQNFPNNSIDLKYSSTTGHEVASVDEVADQTAENAGMRLFVRHTLKELVPGGRLVIRDMAKASGSQPIYMRILSDVGQGEVAPGTPSEDINYDSLSSAALLERFHAEFTVHKPKGQEHAFECEKVEFDGEDYFKILPQWAQEFYLRKDYTGNWRQELHEKYTYWTPDDAKRVLEEEGFINVRVIPEYNEWIIKNRLKGKVALYEMGEDNTLKEVDFPPTHFVVIGEKPRRDDVEKQAAAPVDAGQRYQELFETISIQEDEGKIKIGDKEFQIEPEPILGTKKLVWRLRDDPNRVLKVVRSDTLNDHNVFKSMYQMIGRQDVLEEMGTPYLKILEYDEAGPPYRYVVQEAAPDGAPSAAQLIGKGELNEEDIRQMAAIVNAYEKGKQWQLDTNPFSWFRVTKEDGSTEMVYASSKVYRFQEDWEFRRVGLLQWLEPQYVTRGEHFMAAIPNMIEYQELGKKWQEGGDMIDKWKKYLAETLQPNL